MTARRWRAGVLWALVASSVACTAGEPPRPEATFAVAASLRSVMPELLGEFGARHGHPRLLATYGASLDLCHEVEAGVPIDAAILAAPAAADALVDKGLADGASRRVVATNRLVLIGQRASGALTFHTVDRLAAGEKLAVGDPDRVPAGQYARDYLERLGRWEAVRGRLVLGGDVAAVLAEVRRGGAQAAIVYQTDARGVDDVRVLDAATGPLAPTPEVVAVVVKGAPGASLARSFLAFVTSPDGQGILRRHGFEPPRR